MCTVTLIARDDGFRLGMNRDEQRTRPLALPPERACIDGVECLYPREPGGGTWIGVNALGTGFALINWYAIRAQPRGRAGSRGQIIPSILSLREPDAVEVALRYRDLSNTRPFRLIAIMPHLRQITEWRWDLTALGRADHPWQTSTWISSGHDEHGAQRSRGDVFNQRLGEPDAGSAKWLRKLHASHEPECGPYSTCMHRTDAVTVSYTEIAVKPEAVELHYHAGSPCDELCLVSEQLTPPASLPTPPTRNCCRKTSSSGRR